MYCIPAFKIPESRQWKRKLSDFQKAADAMSEVSGLQWTLLHRVEGGFAAGEETSIRFPRGCIYNWPSKHFQFPVEDADVLCGHNWNPNKNVCAMNICCPLERVIMPDQLFDILEAMRKALQLEPVP